LAPTVVDSLDSFKTNTIVEEEAALKTLFFPRFKMVLMAEILF
jgi:hypothetical protein